MNPLQQAPLKIGRLWSKLPPFKNSLILQAAHRHLMESLSLPDIHYLMALNASEESDLIEVARDFERWTCEKSDVLNVLRSLIQDDTVLISKPVDTAFDDLEKAEALALTNAWDTIRRNDLVLCLSDKGIKRWESDDWGITRERARYLMFSNQH